MTKFTFGRDIRLKLQFLVGTLMAPALWLNLRIIFGNVVKKNFSGYVSPFLDRLPYVRAVLLIGAIAFYVKSFQRVNTLICVIHSIKSETEAKLEGNLQPFDLSKKTFEIGL